MSFHSRLKLIPISFVEPNHGALETLAQQNTKKRFSMADLGFQDTSDDFPNTLEVPGCTFTSEMFIVFPGHTAKGCEDDFGELLLQVFEEHATAPTSMIWIMYGAGIAYDSRVRVQDGEFTYPPGTYAFKPDAEDGFVAEFNLLQ